MTVISSVLLCCVFAAVGAYGAQPSGLPKADPANKEHVIQPKVPDITHKVDSDELRVWYVAKGTRSEGVHGALRVEGDWVEGTEIGESITCKSGWLPKDLSTVFPSRAEKTSRERTCSDRDFPKATVLPTSACAPHLPGAA